MTDKQVFKQPFKVVQEIHAYFKDSYVSIAAHVDMFKKGNTDLYWSVYVSDHVAHEKFESFESLVQWWEFYKTSHKNPTIKEKLNDAS